MVFIQSCLQIIQKTGGRKLKEEISLLFVSKQEKNNTEVSFEVDFELKNEFMNIVMTKSFQFGLNKIADAFQKRAEHLFKKA